MGIVHFLEALLVLALMIFIHELGHYTAGRLLGFKILDFSIGFGPAIFKFRRKDIDYALRAIPLGGACRFYGEEDDPTDAVSFNAQKPWKRLIVIFAGPLMNFVLAYVLAVLMLLCYGEQKEVTYPSGDYAVVINDVGKDSPAEKAGLQKEDIIIAVNGTDITAEPHDFEAKTETITKIIKESPAEGLTIKVLRDDAEEEFFVSDIYNASQGRNFVGVTMGTGIVFVRQSLGKSLSGGFGLLVKIVTTTYSAIINGFKNGFHEGDVSGVVGTVALTMKMASIGGYYLLLIIVLISMSLGIMNLLPILPLDGGHLLFDFIELIFGKPVPRSIQNVLSMIGVFLLLLLMVYATVSDIRGIAHGLFS